MGHGTIGWMQTSVPCSAAAAPTATSQRTAWTLKPGSRHATQIPKPSPYPSATLKSAALKFTLSKARCQMLCVLALNFHQGQDEVVRKAILRLSVNQGPASSVTVWQCVTKLIDNLYRILIWRERLKISRPSPETTLSWQSCSPALSR